MDHFVIMSDAARTNDGHEEADSSNNVQRDQKKTKKTFVHELFTSASKMLGRFMEAIDQLLDDVGAYIFLEKIAKQLAKHPFLAFGISTLILCVSIPFIIFMMFAILTVLMTFFGFVIVEGTLITIASVMLFGFLGAVVILFIFFGSVLMAGYFGLMQIYDMIYPPNLTIKFHQPPTHQRLHQHAHHHASR